MNETLIELREQICKCFKCFPELKDYSHEEKIKIRKQNNREPWFFEHDELKGFYGTGIFFVSQRPSIGKSHNSNKRVLRYYSLLKKYGFSNAHMTDLVKCRRKIGKLTTEEKTNCIHWLLEEIALLKPKLVVGVGGDAFDVLRKLDLPVRLEKILHYSQWQEKPDFVEVFENKLQFIRELANKL